MKFKIKKSIFLEILFIFLLSLTPLLWFRPGEMMVGHDNVFPLDPQAFLKGRLYTWNQNQIFGQDQSLIMGTISTHLIDALPSFLGLPLQTTQKLVYVFWFFLIGLSVYLLSSLINPQSRFFKLFVVLFYQFNFLVLQGWFIGERTKFSAYIALPLLLSVFVLVYRQKITVVKGAILNSLILFLFNGGGLFGFPLYGGLFVCLGVFILLFSFLDIFSKNYQSVKRLALLSFLSLGGVFLVNSYFLLPALSQIAGRYGSRLGEIGGVFGILAWVKEISAGASFINLFRLQGIAEWYDNPQHPYAKYFLTSPILILNSYIFPLLVFISLILIKEKEKSKFIFYFFFVYLIGLFLAAGTHPPLGFLYVFLMKAIPGFVVFRSPYFKFAPAIIISSSFLCAFTLDWLKEKIGKRKILGVLFCLFWFVLILAYHFPYFTGNFFNWRDNFSTRLKVPQYIFDFGDWLEKEKDDDYRILLLPPNSSEWQYDVYKWGYLSLEPLGWLFNAQSLVVNGEKINKEEQILLDVVYKALLADEKQLFERISSLLRIKYLVVRKDFFYDLAWAETENPFLYLETIKKFNYPQIKEFGEWEVYEVDFASPKKLFVFTQPDLLDSSQEKELISGYLRLNPKEESQFIIKKDGEYLSVSEEEWNRFIIPQCLNCRHEKKPSIHFPERKVLPNSIIYPLVLLKEKMELKKTDSKSMIYDEIGLSLKRTAEIREMIVKGETIKSEHLKGYLSTLERINKGYDQIQEFDDKFQISEDLNYFLEAQNEYLLQTLLDRRAIDEQEAEKLRDIFLTIKAFQDKIKPFLLNKEKSNNRLYSFSVEQSQSFDLLLERESVQGALGGKSEIEITLDNQLPKRYELLLDDLKSDFINLDRVELSKGRHHLLLSLPPLSNLLEEFTLIEEEFWGMPTKCFSSKIRGFDNKNVYKVDLSYINDFSEDFLMIIRKKKENEEKLESIFEFVSGHDEKQFEELIYSEKDVKEVEVEFCAPELTRKILAEKVHLRVAEVIQSLIILAPQKIQKTEITSISFEEVNPTRYRIRIRNAQPSFMLGFLERFDNSWKLSGFEKNHFKLNGYANGWQINKEGDYDLVLEYTPQKLFYWGALISGLAVILSLLYLFR